MQDCAAAASGRASVVDNELGGGMITSCSARLQTREGSRESRGNAQNETPFAKMKSAFSIAAAAAAAAALVCSCEEHSLVSGGDTNIYLNDQGATASQSAAAATSSAASSGTVSGTWSGRSATGQVSSKLSLSESGGKISGSLAWPGDTRSVSGSRNGSAVTLNIGGGDVWKLVLSGNKLSGTGYKKGGGTYSCSFSR